MSASLTAKSDKAGREDLEAGLPPITSLMSKEQTDLAGELLIPLDDVKLLGPITAHKWEHERDGDIDAEEWTVGNLHFLEISVVATADPEEAQQRLTQRVLDGGLKFEDGPGTEDDPGAATPRTRGRLTAGTVSLASGELIVRGVQGRYRAVPPGRSARAAAQERRRSSIWLIADDAPSTTPMSRTCCRASAVA